MLPQISPSILSADFGKLNEEIASIEPYVDSLHLDVMDGHFVPNLTFGAPIIRHIKSDLPKNAHLMVTNPEDRLQEFIDAKVDSFCFHIEACQNPHELITKIHDAGIKAGISLNPETPVENIYPILPQIDYVLIMTVHPGFGGQSFMEGPVEYIRKIRKDFPNLDIEVDGGINDKTAQIVIEAGATTLISGSYIFKAENRKKAIDSLRKPQ